jgi:hypothetical protein
VEAIEIWHEGWDQGRIRGKGRGCVFRRVPVHDGGSRKMKSNDLLFFDWLHILSLRVPTKTSLSVLRTVNYSVIFILYIKL